MQRSYDRNNYDGIDLWFEKNNALSRQKNSEWLVVKKEKKKMLEWPLCHAIAAANVCNSKELNILIEIQSIFVNF